MGRCRLFEGASRRAAKVAESSPQRPPTRYGMVPRGLRLSCFPCRHHSLRQANMMHVHVWHPHSILATTVTVDKLATYLSNSPRREKAWFSVVIRDFASITRTIRRVSEHFVADLVYVPTAIARALLKLPFSGGVEVKSDDRLLLVLSIAWEPRSSKAAASIGDTSNQEQLHLGTEALIK